MTKRLRRMVHISEPLADRFLEIAKKLKRNDTGELLLDRLKLYLKACEMLVENKNYKKAGEIYKQNVQKTFSNLQKLNVKIPQNIQKEIQGLFQQITKG